MENAKKILGDKSSHEFFNIIDNMICHNLCTYLPPPQHYQKQLGLGLNLCIKSKETPADLTKTMVRFKRDIRLIYNIKFDNNDEE